MLYLVDKVARCFFGGDWQSVARNIDLSFSVIGVFLHILVLLVKKDTFFFLSAGGEGSRTEQSRACAIVTD